MSSEMPTPVKVDDLASRVSAVQAVLRNYRALPNWRGKFKIEETTTEAYAAFMRTQTKTEVASATVACTVTVSVTPEKTSIQLDVLDKNGKVEATLVGDQSNGELKDLLNQVKGLLFFTEVDDVWDFYAGEAAGIETYVGFSSSGWTEARLNKSRGFLPDKIVRGCFIIPGSESTVFSDYRQDASGRWTAWKLVDTLRVPGKDSIGKIVTITIETITVPIK